MTIKIKRPTRIAANQRVTGKKILPYDPSYLFANGEVGVWYDPSDLSTMFQDAAGTTPVTGVEQPVGRILDKSGRGNHASQSVLGSRPTLKLDENGLPYLLFDGTDDSLQTSNIDFSSTDKVTVFAGVRKLSNTFGIITEFGPSSASNNNSFHLGSDTIYGFFSRGTTRTDAIVSAASPRTDVLTGIGNVSGDNTILRLNGIQADIDAGDQGTGNYGTYPLYIGARGGTANRFNGRLYSLIVRGAETPEDYIAATERWINNRTKAY